MSKKWHSGPPPSIGWWPASVWCNVGIYRWWDGENWSRAAVEADSAEDADIYASYKCSGFETDCMMWQHRPSSWPARSRT